MMERVKGRMIFESRWVFCSIKAAMVCKLNGETSTIRFTTGEFTEDLPFSSKP